MALNKAPAVNLPHQMQKNMANELVDTGGISEASLKKASLNHHLNDVDW